MTSKFELDLYFMMIYPSVKFERNCCIPSKVIDRKPQIDNLAKIKVKKGHNTVEILQNAPFFKLDLYLMMIAQMKLMHPFKSYRSETKSVTPRTTTTMTTAPPLESWSLFVVIASQATQQNYSVQWCYVRYID